MDIILYLLVVILIKAEPCESYARCLSGCSCIDDRHGRSLICMEESAFGAIPESLPDDLTKIRIEKSHFTEIPRGAFSKTPAVENLWLNFNDITVINSKGLEGLRNLTELRLQGNKLRSVPWTAFEDTPTLKILDLKHNQLDVLPEHALKFLPGLTYLDLSFNRLTVISKEVFQNWPLYQKIQSTKEREATASRPNVVLALHDNAWLCDCRLKGFVEFIVSLSPPIILMNSYLTCSGPDFRAGKFFHEIELQACAKPVVSTPKANMSLPQGSNLTLHCYAKARPDPAVWWTYGLKIIRGFHESQERVSDDTIRSLLVIPSLSAADQGVYTCTAVNFIGNSSASVLLDVRSADRAVSSHLPGLPAASGDADLNVFIDIRIAKQTVRGISIEWFAALERPTETWFTIHFGRADDVKKEITYIGPGIHSYSISDLMPATKYEICVTLKNQEPRPGQCIMFVTGSDITEMEQREKLIHIVVIVLAMVLAVPIGMYACTTDTRFPCFEVIMESWKRRQRESSTSGIERERQGTFDSLQAASDEELVNKDFNEDRKVRRRSEDRLRKGKADQSRLTAELY
ncbi:leucine-rich repeat, immunoglobulin-like domain and transmembrane domain-containing protein 2 isoform X1 [Girardinichthys multiradiatus]|uniref:leucine-rich repeat, immunoglobulin-like domain and transmembrane domain-containing protein 2 isoform X1 n=1 Tax=Girardinichthys multiradiatus TaxID=208333 RepID=UPI001FAD3FC0|nr:leucine-rich repeat, immunoglobulin-like domain and transmembrane domain-containing protein 2 isoform X1 [Girardinichthys multiradiatus]